MFKQFKLIDKTSSYKSGSSIAGVGVNSKNLSPEEYKSLIFSSGSSQYLNRTPASAGNRKTWTWSGWVKISSLSVERMIATNTDTSGYNGMYFGFRVGNTLEIGDYGVGSWDWVLTTSALFRDTSAWYHIVVAADTTQATASNRIKIYINGSQLTSFSTATYPSQNADLRVNSTSPFSIGRVNNNSYFFNGYMSEIYLIDGRALSSENFGYFDTIGIWQPRKYSGSYGINGFYLPLNNPNFFELAKDKSGNSNHWTLNGYSSSLASNVVVSDSPVSNYATWNPIEAGGYGTFSDGNLVATSANGNGNPVRSTISFPTTGKWYCEITGVSVGGNSTGVGIILNTSKSRDSGTYYYQPNGQKYINTSASAYGSTWTNNDIIGIALDEDAGTLVMYKNNVSQGTLASGLSGQFDLTIAGGGGHTIQCYVNFGQRPFAYAVPSGFKTLCTQNLPTPSIKKPSSYMDVVTYTGTGAALTISGLGFSPDLVWIKGRSGATDHALYDSVRGVEKRLESNTTDAEVSADGGVTTFNSGGFTLGTLAQANTNTATYVAWAWDEAPIAGMDIVSYVGDATNRTIPHNLGVAPKMMIVRNRDSSVVQNWQVYHANLTSAVFRLRLNTTDAQDSVAGMWNSTAPTSSVFSVGTETGVNENGKNLIAYLFAEVEGFSRFGSYTGNASTDGPFVYCGFRPRWVMVKRTDTSDTWNLHDTARSISNVVKEELRANASNAEAATNDFMDILSNGFKLKANLTSSNASGGTYIFAAFAEAPFKYARAR